MIKQKLIYDLYNRKGLGRVRVNSILADSFYKSKSSKIDVNELLENELSKYEVGSSLDVFEESLISQFESEIKQYIHFINFTDLSYPSSLNLLGNNRPTILTCVGNLELLKKNKIGFCGSRKATGKGFEIAKDISEQVSTKDIVVVSGYASGIDMETHLSSLTSKGETIIVLPEGILNFKVKRALKKVWDWSRVLVISEFEPYAIWSVSRAMTRNSTIVALSDIMVLIEARRTGGSIDAGLKTLQFNKPLFAPVYEGMPEEASGNQFLLEKGALPIRKKRETNKANLGKMFEIFDSAKSGNKTLFG